MSDSQIWAVEEQITERELAYRGDIVREVQESLLRKIGFQIGSMLIQNKGKNVVMKMQQVDIPVPESRSRIIRLEVTHLHNCLSELEPTVRYLEDQRRQQNDWGGHMDAAIQLLTETGNVARKLIDDLTSALKTTNTRAENSCSQALTAHQRIDAMGTAPAEPPVNPWDTPGPDGLSPSQLAAALGDRPEVLCGVPPLARKSVT